LGRRSTARAPLRTTSWLVLAATGTALGGCGPTDATEELFRQHEEALTLEEEILFPREMGQWDTAVATWGGDLRINDRARVFGGALTNVSAGHRIYGAEPAITSRFIGTLFAPRTTITLYENPGGNNH